VVVRHTVAEMTLLADFERLASENSPWRSGSEQVSATVDDATLTRTADVLDGPPPGPGVPPMWLSVVCAQWPAAQSLGADGHPREGVAFPPIPDRRRVFAGARVEAVAPARVGDLVTRTSQVTEARAVQARTGLLMVVTLEHLFRDRAGAVVAREQHDLAYRSGPAAPIAAPTDESPEPRLDGSVSLVADTTRLFRFSSLTANSHRIHYDLPYAVEAEGLPGLLVHGPLMGMVLLEVPRRACPERTVVSFEFRIRRPATAGARLLAHIVERADDAWSLRLDADGVPVATATASFL